MNESDHDQAMRSVGVLDHEVAAGGRADGAGFDRAGYAVGRAVLDPAVLREVRAPFIEAVQTDGLVEAVEGEPDLFRWIGRPESLHQERRRYRRTLRDRVEELLIRPGAASAAIETLWGRRAVCWVSMGPRVFAMPPGGSARPRRDGWQMMGPGGPAEHVDLWIPLTRIGVGDGPLGLAVGSQHIADVPPEVPLRFPIHIDSPGGSPPPDQVLAGLWRTTSFEVGDALLFGSNVVHAAVPNDGPYLRLAIALLAQDATLPIPLRAGVSTDVTRELTDLEWLALAILCLQPGTPWLTVGAFFSRGIVGRLWAEQPDQLTYDAFPMLEHRELIERHEQQPKENTPNAGVHGYFHPTERGRKLACEWLTAPEPTGSQILATKLQFCTWLDLDPTALLRATNGAEL